MEKVREEEELASREGEGVLQVQREKEINGRTETANEGNS